MLQLAEAPLAVLLWQLIYDSRAEMGKRIAGGHPHDVSYDLCFVSLSHSHHLHAHTVGCWDSYVGEAMVLKQGPFSSSAAASGSCMYDDCMCVGCVMPRREFHVQHPTAAWC